MYNQHKIAPLKEQPSTVTWDRPEVTFWEGALHPQVLSLVRVSYSSATTLNLLQHMIFIFWETLFY